jgi:hypothetical protein
MSALASALLRGFFRRLRYARMSARNCRSWATGSEGRALGTVSFGLPWLATKSA